MIGQKTSWWKHSYISWHTNCVLLYRRFKPFHIYQGSEEFLIKSKRQAFIYVGNQVIHMSDHFKQNSSCMCVTLPNAHNLMSNWIRIKQAERGVWWWHQWCLHHHSMLLTLQKPPTHVLPLTKLLTPSHCEALWRIQDTRKAPSMLSLLLRKATPVRMSIPNLAGVQWYWLWGDET